MTYTFLNQALHIFWPVFVFAAPLVFLEYLCNGRRVQIFTRHHVTDLAYALWAFTFGYLAITFVNQFVPNFFSGTELIRNPVFAFVSSKPFWIKAIGSLLLVDLLDYSFHRFVLHGPLARLHAIHHAPQELGMFSSIRFHPIESVIRRVAIRVPMFLAGFSLGGVPAFAAIYIFLGFFSHSNLNWNFGIFKKVILSPMFHRVHHLECEPGQTKNYASLFPLWDILFGTYWLPDEVRDFRELKLGGVNEMPEGFWAQMAFPVAFWRSAKKR
ncbi:MAG: sterol desaturase family protein [Bdellovibrionota bacterium]